MAQTTPGAARPDPRTPCPPAHLSPGDHAAPGTPGTGEGICPHCGGSGRRLGEDCPQCEGSGRVIVGIGGA